MVIFVGTLILVSLHLGEISSICLALVYLDILASMVNCIPYVSVPSFTAARNRL